MARTKKSDSTAQGKAGDSIASIKYPAKRKNLPPAGLEAQGVLQDAPKIRYEYNPHLPPVLRCASDASGVDKLPELLAIARKRPLSAEEAKTLAEALRRHEPWLEWSGKREKPWFEVEPVALHMHERILPGLHLNMLSVCPGSNPVNHDVEVGGPAVGDEKLEQGLEPVGSDATEGALKR